LSLRVNFVNGGEESEGFLFTGSEGTMEIAGQTVTVSRVPREKEPGYTVSTFTNAMQKEYVDKYHQKYPTTAPEGSTYTAVEKFSAPKGYSDSVDHFRNFFSSVRTRKQPVEDATFGFRAAGAALLSNVSYEKGQTVKWDPETMKLG
ncbi:MAG TPA: gfo/Idh/MocA family oxidoreductase, partial [Edaphobacter sp.]